MAWIQKRGNTWWGGWRFGGQQFRQSLKTSDEAQAQAWLEKQRSAIFAQRANALTADFVSAITGKPIAQKPTVAAYLDNWLATMAASVTKASMNKYKQVVREFRAHVGADTMGLLLEDVTVDQVNAFLSAKRLKSAAGTVAGFKRILGAVFLQAQNEGKIRGNPVALCKLARGTKRQRIEKRPFTDREIADLYTRADGFWRYMIVAGFFTGQSLGDLVTLRRFNVDLPGNLIRLTRRKTGTRVRIPLAPRLRQLLTGLWPKSEQEYFWPEQATRYLKAGPSSFSQEFYELLCKIGLVTARGPKHKPTGTGRAAKRELSGLGFHNMRHSFVTRLKQTGAVDSVAKELAGHGSTAVSAIYTHLPEASLANAIEQLKLPEVAK